jgi:hypothetical protein
VQRVGDRRGIDRVRVRQVGQRLLVRDVAAAPVASPPGRPAPVVDHRVPDQGTQPVPKSVAAVVLEAGHGLEELD